MAGAAMEKAVKSAAKKDPKRAKFANALQSIQDECPKKINEYTTLQYVKLKGLNRIEFRYLVSESGRRYVNLNNRWELYDQIDQRTLESPICDSVISMDLSVDHIFRDSDDKQMFSHTVYKDTLKKRKVKNKIAELKAKKAAEEPTQAADEVEITTVSNPGVGVEAKPTGPAKLTISEMPEATKAQTGNLEVGKSWLPSMFQSSRNAANPAGVQSNPFAQ